MKVWELENEEHDKLREKIESFTAGTDVQYDMKLKNFDLLGSVAHVTGLEDIGILSKTESTTLKTELVNLLKEDLELSARDEDIHSKIEKVLAQRLGDLGKKVHTGRSRNDQVLVDLRLFTKQKIFEITEEILQLAKTLIRLATTHRHTPMVGYTHTRKAMPSSVGLWSAAYVESMLENLIPLKATYKLANLCPLGAGAGYGVPLKLNRELTAKLLGFDEPQINPITVMNSRGKYEFNLLSALGNVQLDLSRIAADLITFSEDTYGFFEIPNEFTTGSSIMPQKQNPDVLELIRGKASTFFGQLSSTYPLVAGMRSGYSRDLQEAKAPIFQGTEITKSSLSVMIPLIENLIVNEENLLAQFTEEVLATDKATDLVLEGLPFREAYRQVKGELSSKQNQETVSKEQILDALSRRKHTGGPGNLKLGELRERIEIQKSEWEKKEKEHEEALEKLISGQGSH